MLPLPRDLLVQVLPKTLKVKGCVAKLHVLLLRTFPLGLRKPKGD
jgi:hypothetical protein